MNSQGGKKMEENMLKIPANEFDHRIGPLDASLVIVNYGDFECPYCSVASSVFNRLTFEYGPEICYVFRHFPLRGIHPNAEFAALAAEAAHEQKQFWNFYKLLFDHQDDLSLDRIDLIATRLNIDLDQLHVDMGRPELLERINNDQRGGYLSGVEGTPTIFINNFKYDGATSYWSLREVIEKELYGGTSAFF